MRVLQVNKYYYARGGAERYFLDLMDLLPGAGHEVAPFSMQHARNRQSEYESYFVSHVDYRAQAGRFGAVAAAGRTVYNREARRHMARLIRDFKPDVAHLHNIHHQLTGSVIAALDAARVPMVQTLHDYQWVCPVYTFVSQGEVCEACRGKRFGSAVRRRCHGGSWTKSAVAALELKVGWSRGWVGRVGAFLAPSRFLADKVVEHGMPKDRVRVQDYCLRLEAYRPGGERGDHVLYAGRLSAEKGVLTLLHALGRVPGLELRIAGTGPLEPELHLLADSSAPGRVRFLGYLDEEALRAELAAAAFVVVPSEWYENQPFAVLESFALETPVVGADIGGIPELVVPQHTGSLFESGSVEALAEALGDMAARSDRAELGRQARRMVETRFASGTHLRQLEAIYAELAE